MEEFQRDFTYRTLLRNDGLLLSAVMQDGFTTCAWKSASTSTP
jgi:hypothetical protein